MLYNDFFMLYLCYSFNHNLIVQSDDNNFINVDWSNVEALSTDESSKSESVFNQINNYESTCYCDLMRYQCDISCCCDSDCTNEMKSSFSCIDKRPEKNLLSPNVTNPLLKFLDNFLQVHTEITPYLGEFYSHREIIRSVLKYSETMAKENVTVRNTVLETLDASVYKLGTAVKVVNDLGKNEFLFTNQNSGPGTSCSFNSPVRFGVDQSSKCIRMINEETCRNGTFADAKLYTGLLDGFSVLSSPGGNGTEIRVKIRYNCSEIISVIETTMSEIVSLLTNDSGILLDEPIGCKSSSPVTDLSGGLCRNVAQEIVYQFVWKGQEIVYLTINLYLTDIPLKNEFFQSFDVTWMFDGLTTDKSEHDFYKIGSKILATSLVSPKTNSSSNLLTAHNPKPFQILRATVSGSCESSELVDAVFGINSEGYCSLSLTRNQFKDCSLIREAVLRRFQPMLEFSYLMKNKKLNNTSPNLESLIEILKENPIESSNIFPSPTHFPYPLNTWPTVCHYVPAFLTLIIHYAEVINVNGSSYFEIVGSLLRFDNVTWVYKSPNQASIFLLTNRILFTKVPAKVYPEIKFYLNNELPSCLNAPTLSVCWNELFYAFTTANFTYDEHIYSLVVGLVSVLVIIATFFVTKPWW